MDGLGHTWIVHGKPVTPYSDEDVYELSMKRKFLNHRLADLEYKLSQIRNGIEHGV